MDPFHVLLAPTLQRQHGVFTLAQAEAVGITERQIQRRRDAGELVRHARSVHRIVSAHLSPHALLWAAFLAVPASVVSHRSAAWILRWRESVPLPELTIPNGRHSTPAGVRIHRRLPDMVPRSIVVDGLRVTRPEVTVLDLAAVMGDEAFTDLVDRYAGGRIEPIERLADWYRLVCGRGIAGSARARRELERRVEGDVAESRLERQFLRLIDRSTLPRPELQWVPPWDPEIRVDGAYLGSRVIIELDGHRFHAGPESFERDRRRDQRAAAEGWLTLRITWAQIRNEPEEVLRMLGSTLATRGR